jgi:hypothetical protein
MFRAKLAKSAKISFFIKAYFLGGLGGLCARQFFPIMFRAKYAKGAKNFLMVTRITLAEFAVFARDNLFRACWRQAGQVGRDDFSVVIR